MNKAISPGVPIYLYNHFPKKTNSMQNQFMPKESQKPRGKKGYLESYCKDGIETLNPREGFGVLHPRKIKMSR